MTTPQLTLTPSRRRVAVTALLAAAIALGFLAFPGTALSAPAAQPVAATTVSSQPVPAQQPEPEPDPVPSGCGVFDVSGCISEAFTGLLRAAVTDLVNPALDLVSQTLLQTPTPSSIPRLAELWSVSWQLALACYGLVVLVGGLVVMAHQSVQTRYGVREIAPRLAVGFLAGWLSLPLADLAVQIANAVSGALVGGGVDERAGMGGLAALIRAVISNPTTPGLAGTSWVLLVAAAVLGVLLVALLCGWVLRVVVTIVLVAAAPLVVMWHALPHTDGVARWWWRALAGLLSIQIIQALVLAVGLQILLPPTEDEGSDPVVAGLLGLPRDGSAAGWVTLLVLAVLLWLLVRVPGWVWSQVKLGTGGRSLLTTAVGTAVAVKTGGLLRSGAAGRAVSAQSRSRLPRGWGQPVADSYATPPAFPGGQLGLPLPGLRPLTTGSAPAPPRSPQPEPLRPGPGQLALPLADGLRPEQRPVAGRDGQWRLPIDADRVPRPAQPPQPDPRRAARGQQLRFPAGGLRPEQRAHLGPGGQYRFAFPVPAAPRPPSRPNPGPPLARRPAGARRGRQLSFDDHLRQVDPFRGNRPLAAGQYPLPLPGLTRRPAPPRPPDPDPSGAAALARTPGPGQTQIPTSPPRPPRTTRPGSRPTRPPTTTLPPRPPKPTSTPPPAAPAKPVRPARRTPVAPPPGTRFGPIRGPRRPPNPNRENES